MTNIEYIKRPSDNDERACSEVYTALRAVRSSVRFHRVGLDYELQVMLHKLLTEAFNGHGGMADGVLDYLDDHANATVFEAVDYVMGEA